MLRLTSTILSFFLLITLFGQKTETIFLDNNDTTKNYYTIIYPPELPWEGFIFILPGFGETADNVLVQTDLPRMTAQNGLLTVIPVLQDGVRSFGVDSISQQSLVNIIRDVQERYKLSNQPLFIGGFSIGGSGAIKYAQDAAIKPTAVFAIDPPLDFERLYNTCRRDIRLSVNEEPSPANLYLIDRIEKEFNGTPETALSNFYKISPYSFSDTTQTAVKKLKDIPLRIYSEPDVNWWIKERKSDFASMNVTDCSAMINELNRLGSKNADLIITQNEGYRKPDNKRHPHSWSIVANDKLIEWLLKL